MKTFAATCLILLLQALRAVAAGPGETEFIGLFLQGQRLGYLTSTEFHEPSGKRTVTTSKINAKLLGQETRISMASEAWSSREGKLLKQAFTIESGGRTQRVTAQYEAKMVRVERHAEGNTEKRTVEIPPGALIVDDATLRAFGKGIPEKGTKLVFYAFDPMALMLIRNESEFKGEKEVEHDGKHVKVVWLRVKDPRAVTDFYLNRDGSLLYATSLLGIMLKPITREEAIGTAGYAPSVDLATASSVRPDRPIENPRRLTRLVLLLEGGELERLKSSAHQTVVAEGAGGLRVTVHPVSLEPASASPLAQVRRAPSRYSKAVVYLPSNDPTFTSLAVEIVGGEKNSHRAALKISEYVHGIMRPNATIGILRDAHEVLRTREGVCRDYSILTATLLRAAGIPSKVVTGAVYWESAFYYHAWVEAWVGSGWQPTDPTLGGGFVDATHIKFTDGNADEAFIFFTLDGVKIKVLETGPAK